MAFSKLFVVVLVALLVLAAPPQAEAAIGTSQVVSALSPCRGYLTGKVALDPKCCPGIKSLKNQAKTKQDRQTVCNIIKSIAPSFGNNYSGAQGLLSKCGVSLGYTLSPTLNCARIG